MNVGTPLRLLLVAATSASALVFGGVPPASAGSANAASSADGERWSIAEFPSDVTLTSVVKADHHTTLASGFLLPIEHDTDNMRPRAYLKDDRAGGTWTELPTASGVTGRSNAMAATSARDAWLVGDAARGASSAMTQHWDGHSWKLVPSAPLPENRLDAELLAVTATSPSDVWAVGDILFETKVPDPNGGPPQAYQHTEGLIEHWDGQAWTRVTVPVPAPAWSLFAVSASGPRDVWAVGTGGDRGPLVLHFDGHAWTVVPAPRSPASPACSKASRPTALTTCGRLAPYSWRPASVDAGSSCTGTGAPGRRSPRPRAPDTCRVWP